MSRSGRPRHRVARLEHVLRWWARWLPTTENPGCATAEPVYDGVEPAPHGDGVDGEQPSGEPLTVRATRVN
jgi:hypothetical protein